MQISLGKTEYMWVAVRDDLFDISTISYYKKQAIAALMEGTRMDWKEFQRYGWRVVKCSIQSREKGTLVITILDKYA